MLELFDYLLPLFLFFVVGPALILCGGLIFQLIARIIAGDFRKDKTE